MIVEKVWDASGVAVHPKGVQWALCNTLEFFHSNRCKKSLHGVRFVHRGNDVLEHDSGLLVPVMGNYNSLACKVIQDNCVLPTSWQQFQGKPKTFVQYSVESHLVEQPQAILAWPGPCFGLASIQTSNWN